MRVMGLEAIYPKPRTTLRCAEHKIYPYLLRNVEIERPNHVWSTDITYIPLQGGYVYLTAVIDWYSRYVLSWRLSNTLDGAFYIAALEEALVTSEPEIFNTDQGVQFTSLAFTGCLESRGVAISMDGRGRALDNVFVERLWRTVKYEEVYLKDYANVWEAETSLREYFEFYCYDRRHQSLNNRTPAEVYGVQRTKRSTRRRRTLRAEYWCPHRMIATMTRGRWLPRKCKKFRRPPGGAAKAKKRQPKQPH